MFLLSEEELDALYTKWEEHCNILDLGSSITQTQAQKIVKELGSCMVDGYSSRIIPKYAWDALVEEAGLEEVDANYEGAKEYQEHTNPY